MVSNWPHKPVMGVRFPCPQPLKNNLMDMARMFTRFITNRGRYTQVTIPLFVFSYKRKERKKNEKESNTKKKKKEREKRKYGEAVRLEEP